uniref:RanBD1 domain-containing protein n=1 Tax=Glossina palpalis gambiensis TaxID=67801 RepID=A0A1B0C7Q3_9MUSC
AAGVLAFTSSLPASTKSSDKLGFLNGEESVSDAFSLNRKVFNFTLKPKSPGKSGKSPSKFGSDADGAGDEDTESEFPDEEESSAHFTPIITLPEKVKVKTGEEEEETLYQILEKTAIESWSQAITLYHLPGGNASSV